MTLREIQTLLAICLRDHETTVEEVASADEVTFLVADGLLAGSLVDGWAVTEKAEAYIQALLSVPLPVQRWVIPEANHAVTQRAPGEVYGSSGAQSADREEGGHSAEGGARVQPARRRKRTAKQGDEAKE